MKKSYLALFFLFLSFTVTSFASSFPPHDYFDVYAPSFKGGFKFGLGITYLRPAVPQLDFAFTTSDVFRYDSLHPSYAVGYELDLGYEFPCSAYDVRLNYIHLWQHEADDKEKGGFLASAITDIPIVPSITDVVTVVGVPGVTAIATGFLIDPNRLDFIQARNETQFDKIDLEFSQSIHITPDLRLRFQGGLRGTRLKNSFSNRLGVNFAGNGTVDLTGTVVLPAGSVPFVESLSLTNIAFEFRDIVQQRSDFSGLGPRMGLEANYHAVAGISFFGSLSSALLVGKINSSITENTRSTFTSRVASVTTISSDPDVVVIPTLAPGDIITEDIGLESDIFNTNKLRIVPDLETKLGVSYMFCLPCTCSRTFVEVGYLANHYFNSIDRITNISSDEFLPIKQTHDLTIDGLYLKVEMHI